MFGVFQYTVVFRQVEDGHTNGGRGAWTVVRPAAYARGGSAVTATRDASNNSPAHMFAAPICSVLSLEGSAYEHFLISSGVLSDALEVLRELEPESPASVETARRQIQSLVMAAEVRHIVDRMPA